MAELSLGYSRESRNDFVRRWRVGVHSEKHHYSTVENFVSPSEFPEDVDLFYPFVQLDLIEDKFAVGYNINQIFRTEDLHVGKLLNARLGYDSTHDSRLIFDGNYADTLLYRPKMLLQVSADWTGRWNLDRQQWEDSQVGMHLMFNRGQTKKRTLFIGFDANYSEGLFSDPAVSLGGSNGLRGFDAHYLNGSGSLLLSIEQRYFSDYHLLQLARIGYAAFVDVGQIYSSVNPLTDGVYTDVGLGLRLAPSKSEKGRVMHFDFSYPVSGFLPEASGWQFTAEIKTTF